MKLRYKLNWELMSLNNNSQLSLQQCLSCVEILQKIHEFPMKLKFVASC